MTAYVRIFTLFLLLKLGKGSFLLYSTEGPQASLAENSLSPFSR